MTRVLSLANQITLLRLIFVPVFVSLVVGRHYAWALVVLAAAALSDGVDGLVARKLHQQTALGVALDPIADKILMTTAYLALSFRGALPWWLTIVVITRDLGILITAALISLVAGYRPFPPSFLGKTSTVTQVAAAFFALALAARVPLVDRVLVRAFIDLAAAFTAASGIHYLIIARHRFAAPTDEDVKSPVSERERSEVVGDAKSE